MGHRPLVYRAQRWWNDNIIGWPQDRQDNDGGNGDGQKRIGVRTQRSGITGAQPVQHAMLIGTRPSSPWKPGSRVLIHPDDLPLITAGVIAGQPLSITASNGETYPVGEAGLTGLDVRHGRIYQEYNATLQNLQTRMAAYEEMRRSDSGPGAIESVMTLPIMQAQWRIEAVEGCDQEFAKALQWNLFDPAGMSHDFKLTIRSAIMGRLYGFSVHNQVFESKPDQTLHGRPYIGWRKFMPMERATIQQWQFDSSGGLKGLIQRGRRPDGDDIVDLTIPIVRLIVWSWPGDDGNPEGLGAYRQAYKHYKYKEALEEFAAIRIERQACGVPIGIGPPEGYTETEATALLEQLARLRTAEDSSAIVPNGWQLSFLNLGPADVPFESHIERQHQSILQTILAQFVGLGQGGDSGAWALSRDASGFFVMSLEAVADWICSTFNRYGIARLAGFNGPIAGPLPRLVHGKIGVRDVDALTRAVGRMFAKVKGRWPEEIEDAIREEAGMPVRTADSEQRSAVSGEGNGGEGSAGGEGKMKETMTQGR